MAEPKRTAEGTWRVFVNVGQTRKSRTFLTQREARLWRDAQLVELQASERGTAGANKTLADVFERYAKEVSSTRKGERWELLRLAAFASATHGLPMYKRLPDLRPDDFSAWRDRRLAKVSAGTVLREVGLLSAVLEAARRDWAWLHANPLTDMRKPPTPAHRERVLKMVEVRKMLRALGYARQVRSVSSAVAHAMLLALFTGMRAGEICALRWADVRPEYVVLHTSKTGKGREVALTHAAARVIAQLRGWDGESVTGLQPQTLDALYRRARARAGLAGFTFHDLRHTAATRLATKMHPADLARMFGWSGLGQVMTYYNASGSDIARRLRG